MYVLSICGRSSCIKQYILLRSIYGVLSCLQGRQRRLPGLLLWWLCLLDRLPVLLRYVGEVVWWWWSRELDRG